MSYSNKPSSADARSNTAATQNLSSPSGSASARRFGRGSRSVIACLLLPLAGLLAWQAHRQLSQFQRRQRLDKTITESLDLATSSEDSAYRELQQKLRRADADFAKADANVECAVTELCSMTATRKICLKRHW
jgi:uncharacterized protein HemX